MHVPGRRQLARQPLALRANGANAQATWKPRHTSLDWSDLGCALPKFQTRLEPCPLGTREATKRSMGDEDPSYPALRWPARFHAARLSQKGSQPLAPRPTIGHGHMHGVGCEEAFIASSTIREAIREREAIRRA